jgi:hypothetical protein
VDQGVVAAIDDMSGLCRGRANEFGDARYIKGIGKPKHLLDTMKLVRCGNGAVQRDAL